MVNGEWAIVKDMARQGAKAQFRFCVLRPGVNICAEISIYKFYTCLINGGYIGMMLE